MKALHGILATLVLPIGIICTLATPQVAQAGSAGDSSALSATVPARIKSRGKIIVGVKCDYPPFGYVNASGKHAGFEIDFVHRLAYYAFGNRDAVELTCVTGPNRIPYITSGRVDFVVSVLSYTTDRAKIIGFSAPYFDSGIHLLVPKNASIKDWSDVRGKTVTTIRGGTPSIWLTKCMPHVHQLLFDNTADSLAALTDKRAVAYAQDQTLLVGITSKNPNYKIVGTGVARGPFGVGVKLGDKKLADWLSSVIAQMTKHDFFWKDLQHWVPKDDLAQFKNSVPRPGGRKISYSEATNIYQCYGF